MTDVPGTTRDVLEVSLDIGGLPVVVADTAGIRETDDIVEKIGVERAADVLVLALYINCPSIYLIDFLLIASRMPMWRYVFCLLRRFLQRVSVI